MIQTSVVIMLLMYSVLHAAWVLMPRSMRRTIARKLQRLPLPLRLGRIMSQAASETACACHGCEKATDSEPTAINSGGAVKAQPIVFHRKNENRR